MLKMFSVKMREEGTANGTLGHNHRTERDEKSWKTCEDHGWTRIKWIILIIII